MVVSKERQIRVVGIDLAKRSFHLFGMDEAGKQVLSKKLARARLGAFVANLSPCKERFTNNLHRQSNVTPYERQSGC